MAERTPLRVGLVGCGAQGTVLAQAILRTESLRLVACADPDAAAGRRVSGLAGDASTHVTLDALLQATDVDAVIVATPHHLLAPLALSAIRAGKHVLVEKPIALDEQQAREVEFAAASAGLSCMAGYSFRYSMFRYVHDLVVAGAVGDVRMITGSIGMPPLDTGWIANPETGGGPLLYVGSHLVDLAQWLTDSEPATVYAEVQWREDTGADDSSAVELAYADGRLAQLFITQTASSFFYDVHVYGRRGAIALRGRNFLQFEIDVHSSAIDAYREPTVVRPSVQRDNVSMMFVPELEEFARSVDENRPPAITASDGRRVLRVLDAVRESGRRRQPVAIEAPALTVV